MTDEEFIVFVCEDMRPVDVLILHHTVKPVFKTNLMREICERYPDIVDSVRGDYGLYSDDVYDCIQSLLEASALRYERKIVRTEYGAKLYDCLMSGLYAWDEDVERAIARIKGEHKKVIE